MKTIKRHLIKKIQTTTLERKISGTKILILGPLHIDEQVLLETIKKIKPHFLFLIDGATTHLSKLKNWSKGIVLTVGDGDSSAHKYQMDFLLPTNKNCSDLSFLIDSLISSKITIERLSLLGFSQTKKAEERVDHLLFTLAIIEKISKRLALIIDMDNQYLFLPPGNHVFKYFGTFSLFSFKTTQLSITGEVDYPLIKPKKLQALSSLGLSNKASGVLKIASTQALIVYLAGSK